MRKTNKIILITLVVFILLLGIGYAAIQNITLNISGTAAADPNQANFKVRFVGTPTVSDNVYATAGVTGDTTATIDVNGLSQKGDSVTATYTVKNESTDISADLSVEITNSNIEYFTLKSMIEKESLTSGEETTVTVVVELSKTPIEESVSTNIEVILIGIPVEPGKEGTSYTDGYSQSPIDGQINEYGFYFDKAYLYYGEEKVYAIVFSENDGVEIYEDKKLTGRILPGVIKYDYLMVTDTSLTEDNIYYFSTDGQTLMNVEANSVAYIDDEFFEDMVPVPDGSIYLSQILQKDGITNNEIVAWKCEYMPKSSNVGDIYVNDTYFYTFREEYNGWGVSLYTENVEKTLNEVLNISYSGNCVSIREESYPSILESINGVPIKSLNGTFESCFSLKVAPKIPDGVISLDRTFWGCASLITAPQIPAEVIDMYDTFFGCESLTTVPQIPARVTNLNGTFWGCTSLIIAPEIPRNVSEMNGTFANCTNLSGDIVINVSELNSYDACFENVDMSKITLKGEASKEILNLLGNTGINYTNIN